MTPLARLPLGALSSATSAVICAIPTLVLPADSPNAPKVALLIAGAAVFAVGVVRVRREDGQARGAAADHDGTPES